MRTPSKIASLILIFSTLGAYADISLAPPGKHSKEAERPVPPPEPVPVTIRVKRGGTVEIPLRVFGIPTLTVTYRLRSEPEFGELSGLKMTGPGIGMLTYRHSGEKTQESDHFLYVAQTSNGVSASVKITIAIVDDPPELSAPDGLEWGSVMIGTTAARRFTIENHGGGLMKGTITVDEPWKIDGKAAYNVRSGERQTFALTFAPQTEQTFHGAIRYSSDRRQTTTLVAVAEAAIRILPQTLVLEPSGDTIRAGILKIANRTNEDQPLRLRGRAKLSVPEEVSVPPNGEISVRIETLPGQLGEVAEELQVDAPSFATTIAVQAPAVGPIIRANPASLSFGRVDSGSLVTATLQVTNFGGTNTQVQLVAPAPLAIVSADSAFWLDAGATKVVNVSLQASDGGKLETSLHLKTTSGEVEIPVEAELIAKPAAAAASRRIAVASAGSLQPIVRRPLIASLQVARVSPTTCELSWKETGEAQPRYQIERLVPGGGAFGWTPIPNVVITTAGSSQTFGKNLAMHGIADPDATGPETSDAATTDSRRATTALIKDLKAETTYAVRIMAIDAKDDTHQSATSLEFRTPPTLAKTISLHFALPSFLLLSVVTVWRRRSVGTGSVKSKAAPAPAPQALETFIPPAFRRPALPVIKKVPMLREIRPGYYQLDVD